MIPCGVGAGERLAARGAGRPGGRPQPARRTSGARKLRRSAGSQRPLGGGGRGGWLRGQWGVAMLVLENDSLRVEALDPEIDRSRLGARYCAGGYVYQVTDLALGAPLLAGPTWGGSEGFDPSSGQGLPDSFSASPLRDPANPTDPRALVLGVGLCDLTGSQPDGSGGGVQEAASWQVRRRSATALEFFTRHEALGYTAELRRTITLHGRVLRSTTELTNATHVGETAMLSGPKIAFSWYPHPFLPHPEGDELCRFNLDVAIPPGNDGFEVGESGYVRRRGWPWDSAHFQALDHGDEPRPLGVIARHPLVGMVASQCSYCPSLLPIWGNAVTYSWEPYLDRTLSAGQRAEWWIEYEFGDPPTAARL
eukprot:COSAG04_NODE_2182_length_4606_cov_3.538052_1_plen_366_part_00